jgi:hypothetical protein
VGATMEGPFPGGERLFSFSAERSQSGADMAVCRLCLVAAFAAVDTQHRNGRDFYAAARQRRLQSETGLDLRHGDGGLEPGDRHSRFSVVVAWGYVSHPGPHP